MADWLEESLVNLCGGVVSGFSAGVYPSAASTAAAVVEFGFNILLVRAGSRAVEAQGNASVGRFTGGFHLELVSWVDLLGLAALGTLDSLAN